MGSRHLAVVASLVAVGGAVLLLGPLGRPACTVVSGRDDLSIPVDHLQRRHVAFFCYRDGGGKTIRFLVGRDATGAVHSVFDACRQCYRYHKGYTFYHGQVICRLCGNRYAIRDMVAGKGSCAPLPLPSLLRGGHVLVKVSDLEAKRWLF
jgi:uncharacterized membrane protein